MGKFMCGVLLTLALPMSGCSDEFRDADYEPGAHGEPPRALQPFQVYTKQLVAEQKNYVLALGQIHAFLIAHDFLTFYPSCFDDVLNIRVTADIERHKKQFPCVALQAEKGAPTKVYLSVTVNDVMFNQLDYDNRLTYTVSMFGRGDLVDAFVSDVEPVLRNLYANAPRGRK